MAATGTNTAINANDVAMIGPVTSFMAATVAALARGLVAAGLSPAWYDGADLHIAMARHCAGPADHTQAAAMILAHPLADSGILLCDPERLQRRGLPWETCDLAVLCDTLPDDLGAVVAAAAGGMTRQGGGDPVGLLDIVLALPATSPQAG